MDRKEYTGAIRRRPEHKAAYKEPNHDNNAYKTQVTFNDHDSREDAFIFRPAAISFRGRTNPNLRSPNRPNGSPHRAHGREQRRDRKRSKGSFWSSELRGVSAYRRMVGRQRPQIQQAPSSRMDAA